MKITVGNIAECIGKARNRKGFTLIEMAIVLVIIGIILGAVMKGRDVIKSAQIKEFEQNFVGKWVTILNGYYDKTGQNLTDGVPNGGTAVGTNGIMDGPSTGPIYYDGDALRTGFLFLPLRRAGIDPCETVKSNMFNTVGAGQCTDNKNVTMTIVDGEHVGKQPVVMGLTGAIATINGQNQMKNIIIFNGVPLDVALAIDKMHDGVESGQSGSIINLSTCVVPTTAGVAQPVPVLANPIAAAAWPTPLAGAPRNLVCTVGYMLEH